MASVVICILAGKVLFAQGAISYKKANAETLRNFQIFAERCTGSQYVTQLLQRNLRFNEKDRTNPCSFGHKHFPPWFSLASEEYKGPEQYYSLEDSENILFVVVFRNPYDWVRSFRKQPHHGKGRYGKMSFSEFIRSTWKLKGDDPYLNPLRRWDSHLDKDPETGDWFANVLKLRTAKARNMIAIADRVDNIYFVRYETARDHPEEVIEEISQVFGIPRKEGLDSVNQHYRGNLPNGTYTGSSYREISFRDLLYINGQLDRELEKWMGYELTADVHAVP